MTIQSPNHNRSSSCPLLVLARKAKNQYSRKGFDGIRKALEDLKTQGLRDADEDELLNTGSENCNPIGSQQSNNTSSQPDSSSSSKLDNRREKSLGLLTQNFVKLFLCTDAELISLDDADQIRHWGWICNISVLMCNKLQLHWILPLSRYKCEFRQMSSPANGNIRGAESASHIH